MKLLQPLALAVALLLAACGGQSTQPQGASDCEGALDRSVRALHDTIDTVVVEDEPLESSPIEGMSQPPFSLREIAAGSGNQDAIERVDAAVNDATAACGEADAYRNIALRLREDIQEGAKETHQPPEIEQVQKRTNLLVVTFEEFDRATDFVEQSSPSPTPPQN